MLDLFFSLTVVLGCAAQIDGAEKKTGPLVDGDLRPNSAHLSRDGRLLLVAGSEWKIFDLATGKCKVDGTKGPVRCRGVWGAHLSDDNGLVAVGGGGDNLFVIDASSGKLLWDFEGKARLGVVGGTLFTPDGKYLITTGHYALIRIWDVQNKSAHAAFRYTSTNSGLNVWLQAWYFEPAKHLYEIKGTYSGIGGLALTPDGKIMAVGGNLDGEIPLIELATGKVVKTIQLKRKYGSSLQFSADGKWLAVGGGPRAKDEAPLAGSVEIWDVEKNELVAAFGKHEGGTFQREGSIPQIAISPDKKTVLTGGGSDGFRVWEIATGKQKFSYFTRKDPRMPRVTGFPDGSQHVEKDTRSAGVAFLPDGKSFMIAPHWMYGKTEIYFHDTATGEPVDFRKAVKRLPAEKK